MDTANQIILNIAAILILLSHQAYSLKVNKTVKPSCIVDTDEGRLDLSSLDGKTKPA